MLTWGYVVLTARSGSGLATGRPLKGLCVCALVANLHLIIIAIHLGSWQLSLAVRQPDTPADHEVTPGGFQRDSRCICNKWHFGIQEASFFREETDHERDVRMGNGENHWVPVEKHLPHPPLKNKILDFLSSFQL